MSRAIALTVACLITLHAGNYCFALVGHHSPAARLAKVEAILEQASRVTLSHMRSLIDFAVCVALYSAKMLSIRHIALDARAL